MVAFPRAMLVMAAAFGRWRPRLRLARQHHWLSGTAAADLLKPGWESNQYVQQFLGKNVLGQKLAQAPLLIISAEDAENSADAQVVARMCEQSDRLDFRSYRGVDRNELMGTSVATQLSWIKARFDRRMTQNTCR